MAVELGGPRRGGDREVGRVWGGNRDWGESGLALFLVWCVLGFAVGWTLTVKYALLIGVGPEDELSGGQLVTSLCLLLASVSLFLKIGEQLGREAHRGRISWATYWTTLFGVVLSVFAFLGVTGFDDLVAEWCRYDKVC